MAKLNWEKSKRNRPKFVWDKERPMIQGNKIRTLNMAIHKLLLIKQRRIEEKDTPKRIRACQIEVDKLQKMKRDIQAAAQFVEWRKNIS